ncbi:MAG TPA: hypothetical protein VF072_04125 [Thermoleophilaceae bacterium]
MSDLADVSDNLPVLAEARPIERRPPVSLPAVVATAAGGFLLGVITFLAVRVLRRPKAPVLRLGGRRKKSEVAASRSFLVDIHLLKDR